MRGPKPKPFECREEVFWYLVGLIATDGCLSGDGRHLNIAAKDYAFLERIRKATGLSCAIGKVRGSGGSICHRIQFGSKLLYDKLLAIGLTPNKSLTLGALRVPDRFFHDFLRGVIDGDGNIRRWIHPTNGREQWTLRIYGCSRPFLDWIRATVTRLWSLEGAMCEEEGNAETRRHAKYTLKYGKLAAKVILARCYYPGALALERKRLLARACVSTPVGWSKSRTVHDIRHWRGWKYVHVWRDRLPGLAGDGAYTLEENLQASLVEWGAGVAKSGETHWA